MAEDYVQLVSILLKKQNAVTFFDFLRHIIKKS